MTDATTTLRVYTGTNAGNQSSAVTGIDLVSVDNAVNSAMNRSDNPVAPGTNSYEKWLRILVDNANDHALTDFWVERTGDLPDGVTVKMGVTDDPATPVTSTSSVATTTMVAGRRYIFDADIYAATNDATRYLVLQAQTTSAAQPGSIEQGDYEIGWSQA